MAIRVKTIDIDRGWKGIKRQVKIANGSHTKVGVQQGEIREDGTNLVTVAAANEFGVPGHIPARPFIRSTRDGQATGVDRKGDRGIRSIFSGNDTTKSFLGKLGEWFEAKVKKKIVDLREPPNAPSTIARKGSSNPLIDTGQLRASIRHVEKVRGF